jgi:hypothetical protein
MFRVERSQSPEGSQFYPLSLTPTISTEISFQTSKKVALPGAALFTFPFFMSPEGSSCYSNL